MAKLLTLLINLDGSDERLASAKQQLDAQGVNFEKYSAFDGRGLEPASITGYDEARSYKYFARALSGGEIGCYKSHLGCVERFLSTDDEYCLVLEDDLEVSENFQKQIFELITFLNDKEVNWELVNVGRTAHRFYRQIGSVSGADVLKSYYFPITTTALLWNRRGAQAFLDECQSIFAPVDHLLRAYMSKRGTGVSLSPSLVNVAPCGSESDIDAVEKEGTSSRIHIKRSKLHPLREFQRQFPTYLWAIKHMSRQT